MEFKEYFKKQLDSAKPLTEDYFKDLTQEEFDNIGYKSQTTCEKQNAARKISKSKYRIGDKLLFYVTEDSRHGNLVEVNGEMIPEINIKIECFPDRLLDAYEVLYNVEFKNSELPYLIPKKLDEEK